MKNDTHCKAAITVIEAKNAFHSHDYYNTFVLKVNLID